MSVNRITRRPGNIGYDYPVFTQHGIDDWGLANVGPANQAEMNRVIFFISGIFGEVFDDGIQKIPDPDAMDAGNGIWFTQT